MSDKNLLGAFLTAQKEMGNAVKGSVNPFYKSHYADLNAVREACMPALHKNGIVVYQRMDVKDGKTFVVTTFAYPDTKEVLESWTEIVCSKQNDPQAQGSAISYARRYGLQALANIGAEDDDGEKAVERPKVEAHNSDFAKEMFPLPDIQTLITNLQCCETPKDVDNWVSVNKPTLEALPEEDKKVMRDAVKTHKKLVGATK